MSGCMAAQWVGQPVGPGVSKPASQPTGRGASQLARARSCDVEEIEHYERDPDPETVSF